MAGAPRSPNIRVTPQGAFEKLPGKSKRWRNIATGETISDRTMSGLSRKARLGGRAISKEAYTKGIKSGAFAYEPATARRQRHAGYGREIRKHVPEMTPADRRFMLEARDTFEEKGKGGLSPDQKEKWKRLFVRYPKDSVRALLGYPATPAAAFLVTRRRAA
jgi:hypothetical protein